MYLFLTHWTWGTCAEVDASDVSALTKCLGFFVFGDLIGEIVGGDFFAVMFCCDGATAAAIRTGVATGFGGTTSPDGESSDISPIKY